MSQKRKSETKKTTGFKLTKGFGLIMALAVTVVSMTAVLASRNGQVGEEIAIMADYSHVPEGSDPNPYNSNPPTSGLHYADDLKAGFYEENTYQYPEGYLVHNLEHGYVIFWYNCSLLEEVACAALKGQMRASMEAANNYKVIAYPWEKTDVPLVLTSWGRRMALVNYDARAVAEFIQNNQNKAPEPHAD